MARLQAPTISLQLMAKIEDGEPIDIATITVPTVVKVDGLDVEVLVNLPVLRERLHAIAIEVVASLQAVEVALEVPKQG